LCLRGGTRAELQMSHLRMIKGVRGVVVLWQKQVESAGKKGKTF
jgi:hypothetical protein